MNNVYKRILYKFSLIKCQKILLPVIAGMLLAPGISLGQTTIVNYDFSTAASYPVSPTTTASGITSTATSTETFATSGGTATGAGAFTTNSSSQALTMTNSAGTNTRYFTFSLGGASLPSYTTFKVYFQAQRSGTGATTVNVTYSVNGGSFVNTGESPTSMAPGNGSFVEATITLPVNNPTSLDIRLSASGASASGTLRVDNFQVQATAPVPIITPTPTTLTGFYYSQGNGPSVAQSFTLSAANLTAGGGNITITAPIDYQVSVTSATTVFANSVMLPYTGTGTLAANTVWIRLKSGLTAGTYNLETVNISGGGATSSVTVSGTVGPANDDCANAITITPSATCVNTAGTNANATQSQVVAGCSSGTGESLDVWYKFTANGTSAYTISATPPANRFSVVLYSGTCAALTELSCNEAATAGTAASVTSAVLAAGTYYYRVYGRSGSTNSFNTCVTTIVPPANDDCLSAVALTVSSTCSATAGTNVNATQTAVASNCSGQASKTAADVFYSFKANNTSQTIKVVGGTGFDPVVQAFSGSCTTPASLGCIDATTAAGTETLPLTGLTVGATYFIRVYGYSGTAGVFETGTFTICVTGTCLAASGNVTGGGAYCSGGTGVAVGTSTSQLGFSYQLQKGGVNTGSPLAGTGAALSFGNQTNGTYTVVATNTGVSGCNNTLTGTATVTITAQPSATISYAGDPFCSKAGVASVTRTGTSGGTYSSTPGLFISSDGAFNIGKSNSGVYTVTYTIPASGGCNSFTTTTAITINYNTWQGTDTIWNKATNWSCGTVPDSFSNVYLPSNLPFYPVVPIGDFSVRDILLRSGASLIVANPIGAGQAVLTIIGSYNNSGTLADSGRVVLGGSALQTFPGLSSNITALNELEVNNSAGVSFDNSFAITGGLYPTKGNIALNNNYITLKSDSTVVQKITRYNSAFVGTLGTGVSFTYGTGRFVVERFFHAKRAWRLVTAPLTTASSSTIYNAWQLGGKTTLTGAPAGSGVLITGPATGQGLDPGVTSYYSLKTYDAVTGAFVPISNTQGLKLSPGTYKSGGTAQNIGYFMFVRGDRNPALVSLFNTFSDTTTLRDTGIIQTGQQTFVFPLSATPGNKFILLPNPYASPVDFSDIAAGNSSIQNKFWAWDPSAGNPQSVGAYIYLDGLTNPAYQDVPSSPGGQTRHLQSCQAIYVQTTNTNSATITFQESYKSTRTIRRTLFRPLVLANQQLAVNLKFLYPDSSTILADGVLAQFNTSFSNAVDDKDGLKFPNVTESFAIARDGQLLTVERRNLITKPDTLFFNLTRATLRSYQLEFIPDGLVQAGFTGFLEDSYLKTSTPVILTDTTRINFSLNADTASQASDRFRIVFRPSVPVPVTFTKVKAYQQGSNINVEWTVENEMNMKEYYLEKSADGARFIKIASAPAVHNNGITASYISPDASPFSGANYYRVHSISRSGEDLYSNIVKVTIGIGTPQISVYPNPVVNEVITLQLINQPKGNYGIRLINELGQVVVTKEITHEEGSSSETMPTGKKIAHGTYQLEVTGPQNHKTTINVIY